VFFLYHKFLSTEKISAVVSVPTIASIVMTTITTTTLVMTDTSLATQDPLFDVTSGQAGPDECMTQTPHDFSNDLLNPEVDLSIQVFVYLYFF
jgi:hypothetical protein